MAAVAVLTGEVRAEGVGKTIDETTLLRIIGGLLVPSSGSSTIGGREADERDRAVRAAVAALLGAPTTYRDLTLVDHLVLIDSTWGGDPSTSDDRGEALLDRLGIAHLDDRFPHELSSGQEQLFRLALTFSRPARVVLLDEPEQRLDTGKRQVVAELIRERTAAGATVVMACHDPELTASLATRVVDVVP